MSDSVKHLFSIILSITLAFSSLYATDNDSDDEFLNVPKRCKTIKQGPTGPIGATGATGPTLNFINVIASLHFPIKKEKALAMSKTCPSAFSFPLVKFD